MLTMDHFTVNNQTYSVVWCGTKNENADFYIFPEFFKGNSLVDWQCELLEPPAEYEVLGNVSISSLAYIYCVSFKHKITNEIVEALRNKYKVNFN